MVVMLSAGMMSCSEEKDEPKDEPIVPVEGEDFDIFEEISFDEMVFVKGGTFKMGATEEQGTEDPWDDEYPVHDVTLSDFYIGKYEVTQELWEYVMGYNPSFYEREKEKEKLPVNNVTWLDCVDFIANLNKLTGKNFDIPTEAEWEYAARGGAKSKGYKYAGSNNIDEVAWYKNNSDLNLKRVGLKIPNELGLYDMSGNALEWCSDWYDENYYSTSPSVNPTGPATGEEVVCRGGTYTYSARSCRITIRDCEYVDLGVVNMGFRLVCRSK